MAGNLGQSPEGNRDGGNEVKWKTQNAKNITERGWERCGEIFSELDIGLLLNIMGYGILWRRRVLYIIKFMWDPPSCYSDSDTVYPSDVLSTKLHCVVSCRTVICIVAAVITWKHTILIWSAFNAKVNEIKQTPKIDH